MTRFFHGTNRTGPYFEGWYFKHQNPQGQTLALIPAFHIDRKRRRTGYIEGLKAERAEAEKALNNLVRAIEQGVFFRNDTDAPFGIGEPEKGADGSR